jgi:hypothetical protein
MNRERFISSRFIHLRKLWLLTRIWRKQQLQREIIISWYYRDNDDDAKTFEWASEDIVYILIDITLDRTLRNVDLKKLTSSSKHVKTFTIQRIISSRIFMKFANRSSWRRTMRRSFFSFKRSRSRCFINFRRNNILRTHATRRTSFWAKMMIIEICSRICHETT